jgi:hypothetical protein
MIRYQQKGERLVVGTHGRGIFEGEVKEVEADLQFTFVERGPSNIGGRTRTIMLDPNDPSGKKLWAGSIGGGLWVIGNMDSVERFWHKSDGYLLFPNPVRHELTVVFPSGNESDRALNIYSMNGELVYERRDIVFHSEKISLLGLSPGIYIVELFQGDQRTTRKILIH